MTLYRDCPTCDGYGDIVHDEMYHDQCSTCSGREVVPVEPDRDRIANRIAVEFLPDTGPCAFCDSEAGARHRVADAIVDEILALLGIGGDE